jgi:hypothetical protein
VPAFLPVMFSLYRQICLSATLFAQFLTVFAFRRRRAAPIGPNRRFSPVFSPFHFGENRVY